MKRLVLAIVFALLAILALGGCDSGPTHQQRVEQTKSELNLIAEEWDGTKSPPDLKGRTDPWGTPYMATVTKGSLNYELTVRSAGKDKLHMNTDDVYVRRYARHNDTTVNKEVEKGAHSLTKGLFSGAKEGWYGEPKKDEDKK